jgi:vacuolar-type H+-ATPase subunit H
MDENKSLLQQVREKEQVLNIKLEMAAKDAEMIILDAKREYNEILDKADKEGKEAASLYYAGEKKKIEAGVDVIKRNKELEATMIMECARANMPAAVERIIKEVAMQ